MTNKNIVIYYAGFIRFGGVFTHVTTLEYQLRKMGHNVNLITLDRLPFLFRFLPHIFEKIINLINAPLGFYYKGYITRFLYKKFFSIKCDVRIFEDVYISWSSLTPSITILHAVWSDNLQAFKVSDNRLKKLINKEIDTINKIEHQIVTVSDPYREYIIQKHYMGKIIRDIDVVELGINQNNFPKIKKIYNNSIIYVGSLEARKNVLFLLDVFKELITVDSTFKLTIIGDGPTKNLLIDYANTNKISVRFLGSLSNQQIIKELSMHSLYLHPSLKESFSYSLLEAKLVGLKTFANSNLQIPSDFIDVKLDTFDVDEWCKKILDNNNMEIKPFYGEKYKAENMTVKLLDLLK